MVIVPKPRAAAAKLPGAIAAGVTVAIFATGCGGSHAKTSGMSPKQAVTLAARQAKRVTSLAGTLSMRMTGAQTLSMAGTFRMRSRPSPVADLNFSSVNAAGHRLPGGIEEILAKRSFYLKMAPLSKKLGKPWVRIPFSALKRGAGMSMSSLTEQMQRNSPLTQTEMLVATRNVRMVGTQVIDGVKTTEYAGSYPATAAIAALPASMRPAMRRDLQVSGLRQVRFTVWLDSQQQVRQLRVVESGSQESILLTENITAINQPVRVTPPPSGQVAKLPARALQTS